MKSASDLLVELNTLDEHPSIEAKKASAAGSSIMETVCAFANEPDLGGGYLLLGVAPASDSFWPTYEVVGVPDPDKLQQDIASNCATQFNVAVRPRIMPEVIDDKTVVVVYVPEAGPREKPVHFKKQPLPKGARRRIGSTDQRCTEDDLIAFYTDRQGETYDEQILEGSSLRDIDDEAIEFYRTLRREVDPNAEELTWSQPDLLEALGAVKYADGERTPTVAGILLFGTSIALRRLFPMLRIDYIRVPGTQWVKDPDRRFDTVEIRAPLIRAIQRTRSAILDDLPKAFSLPSGEVQGKEIAELPDRVVREVVANAVMHRDYRVNGSIQVIRYANRLEVRNPGFSIKAEERLGEPGSQARNPMIAAVLHEVRFAETKGSGIRVMRDLMAERGLSAPYLQSDRTDNSFLALLLFHHFLSPADIDWLGSFESCELSDGEKRGMISAREVGAIDNSTYRTLVREDDTLAASKHLRRLCDHGLLEKKGSGPKTYYVPTSKALANWPSATTDLSKSPDLEGKSPDHKGKSPDLEGKSPELPPDLRIIVDSLGGKAPGSRVMDAILKLLRWRTLTLSELADYLGRTPDHVRKQYLQVMIGSNIIRQSNPENPNDPRQTYEAIWGGARDES